MVLGEAINTTMQEVFIQPSTKNVSIILICFANVLQCFGGSEELQIPYVEQCQTVL